MTDAEWLACDNPMPMLEFVSGRLTPRKATLYVCAGLRCVWDLLYDGASREAVSVAERAADGAASEEEIREATYYAEAPTFGLDFDPEFIRQQRTEGRGDDEGVRRLLEMGVYKEEDLHSGDELIGDERVRQRLLYAAHIAYHCLSVARGRRLWEHLLEHLSAQAEWPRGWLVREIVGNPFHPVTVSTAWLVWDGGTVPRLAQAIYADRAFDRLPVRADALEDAGCTDTRLLAHCRSGGQHVRGCWAVDLLLGKT